jgi:hypothetical protein
MVKIDSIRHFLRHYALTILMIGQKITYPKLLDTLFKLKI